MKKTSYSQPFDVGINSPFKNELKKSWADWFKSSVPVYTNADWFKSSVPVYTNADWFKSSVPVYTNADWFKSSVPVYTNADWFKSSVPVHTNAGNRKHPDYETMIEMTSNAMKSITPDVIRTSFKVCGVTPYGQDVPLDELNQCLRTVMAFTPNDLISNGDEGRMPVDDGLDDDFSCDDDLIFFCMRSNNNVTILFIFYIFFYN